MRTHATAIRNLETRMNKLDERLRPLEAEWIERIAAASAQGTARLIPGVRVKWPMRVSTDHRRYEWGLIPGWSGVVIPRPHGCREFGKTGDRLIWVMKDGGEIRGCYAQNLVLL